jgi:hypothetical protein
MSIEWKFVLVYCVEVTRDTRVWWKERRKKSKDIETKILRE